MVPPARQSRELTESAALRVLENRDAGPGSTVNQPRPPLPAAASGSSDATRTDATGKNEKPSFAVQLLWSVQPIDITQIPQLAIFSAYTLYGAEGNRDGRRWYGVRLGFFTDAVSAKQVAHYVRSDFSTVSVVPVTARERERARLAAGRPGNSAGCRRRAGHRGCRAGGYQTGQRLELRVHRGQAAGRDANRSDWRYAGCACVAWRARQTRKNPCGPTGQCSLESVTTVSVKSGAGSSFLRSVFGKLLWVLAILVLIWCSCFDCQF